MKGSSFETKLKINEKPIRENRFIFPFCQSIAFWELRPKGRRHQSKGRATVVFQSSSVCLPSMPGITRQHTKHINLQAWESQLKTSLCLKQD